MACFYFMGKLLPLTTISRDAFPKFSRDSHIPRFPTVLTFRVFPHFHVFSCLQAATFGCNPAERSTAFSCPHTFSQFASNR